jgi:rubrerythrin
MSNPVTVDELFDMSIKAERTAEELYRRLQAKFGPQPDAARFWRDYAAAEAGHALRLEQIRNALSPEQLAAPADAETAAAAQRLLMFPVEKALQGIKDLEDAYQLANELESGETNVVFDFLISHFASDAQAQSLIRSQLRDHVAKISTGFPARFRSSASRMSVKVTE